MMLTQIVRLASLAVAATGVALSAPSLAQERKPAYFYCVGDIDWVYYFSGVIVGFDRATSGERTLMYEDYGNHVDRLIGSNGFRQRLTCYQKSSRASADAALAKEIAYQQGRGAKFRATGWSRDYVTGSGREKLSDPGPAVRLVAPGEKAGAPRPPQAMDTIESGQAGTAEIQAAYARQQQRDQQRIDETRRKQAAYEAGVAEANRQQAEYRAKMAAHQAQMAEYQRQLDALCQAKGKAPCAQAQQID